MDRLESELAAARDLDVADLADRIQAIGFECTRCGACCTAERQPAAEESEEHTATVFPDEARALMEETGLDFHDVVRPMPFGLDEGRGETFEWALETDACGDCRFYEHHDADADHPGRCTVYGARPLICRTYPFSVDFGGASTPQGSVVAETGPLRAHECEGLGRDIDRADAVELARSLKHRTVTDLKEAIAVRDAYEPVDTDDEIVVFDSEGPKRADGSPIDTEP